EGEAGLGQDAARIDRGVVHQHVEPPVILDRGRDEAEAVGLAADVGLDEACLALGFPDATHRLLALRRRAIGDDDLGTLAGEEIGGGAADAGADPGHDGHLPRDPIAARSIADGSGLAHLTSSEWKSRAQTETPEKPRGPSGIRTN